MFKGLRWSVRKTGGVSSLRWVVLEAEAKSEAPPTLWISPVFQELWGTSQRDMIMDASRLNEPPL